MSIFINIMKKYEAKDNETILNSYIVASILAYWVENKINKTPLEMEQKTRNLFCTYLKEDNLK